MVSANSQQKQSFYGWKILCLATFCQFVSVGFSVYMVGLFIEPLSKAFSATPGQLGWASSILLFVGSAMGPLLGYWADREKVKQVLCGGAVCLALGFILLSQANGLWMGALICIFLIGPGAAMLGIVIAGAMLVKWFEQRRGLALGIAASGVSFGGFLMPAVVAWMLTAYGWRDTSMTLGIFLLVVLLPVTWLIPVNKPADIGQFPDGVEKSDDSPPVQSGQSQSSLTFKLLLARFDFWIITLVIGSLNFSSIAIITYLIPFSREQGIGLQESALMLSTYAGSAFIGKFLFGWLADKIHPRRLLSAIPLVMAAGLFPMLNVDSIYVFVGSIAIVGLALGGLLPIWGGLIARNFGPQAFGRVKGAMSLILTLAAVIPGPLGGYLYDSFGSYAMLFNVLIAVLIIGFIISILMPENSKPIGQDGVLADAKA